MNENAYTDENKFPDELISAYLDGELTDAQKVRVEEQLMDSPEHRRLFEELKALRSSLQALPQEALGDDFAQRVLRRAEQELLTGDVAASEAVVQKRSAATSPSAATVRPAKRDDHERGAWRGLIWSAAAMAAAIGLIVFSPMFTKPPNRGVAVNDTDSERLDHAAEHAKANNMDERNAAPVAQQQKSKQAKQDQIAAQGNQPVEKGQPAKEGSQAISKASDGAGFSQVAAAKELKLREQREESPPPAVNEDQVARRGSQQSTFSGGGASNGAHIEAGGSPPPGAIADNRAGGPPANSPVLDQTGGKAVPMAAFARGREASAAANPGMLVVSLDVTPDALKGHFMDEMLKKHEIQLELAKAEVDRAVDHRTADKDKDVARLARDAEYRDAKDGVRKKAQEAGRGGDVELMYVVASVEQIDGLLGDLKSQSEQVLALAYDQPLALQQENKNKRVEAEQLRQQAYELANPAPPSPIRADTAEKAEVELDAVASKPLVSATARSEADAALRPAQQGGQSAVGGRAAGDEAKADDKYVVDAQSFRGIARRLHLPEDFRVSQPQAKLATTDVDAGQEKGSGGGNFSPAAIQHSNFGGAASTGAPVADSVDGSPLVPGLKVLAKGQVEKQAAGEKLDVSRKRALAVEQPAMRVLFVLRAVRQPSPPTDPIPADAAASEAAPE